MRTVGTSAEWADHIRSSVDDYSNGADYVTVWRIKASSSFRLSPLLSLPVVTVVLRWLQDRKWATISDSG